MADLSTTYLGMTLRSPLVPSASPLSRSLDVIRRMEDAGAGVVVLHSLFQEQILRRRGARRSTRTSSARGPVWRRRETSGVVPLRYFPEDAGYWPDPDDYVEHVGRAKAVVAIPVIASLNGVAAGELLAYAGHLEQAGADALEVGVYYLPTDPDLPGGEVEQLPVDILREVGAGPYPRRGQARPVLLQPGRAGAPARGGGGRTASSSSAGSTSRTSTSSCRGLALYPTLSTINTPGVPCACPCAGSPCLSGTVPCDLAGSGGVHGARGGAQAGAGRAPAWPC